MDAEIFHVSGATKTLPLFRAQEQVAADPDWSFEPHPPKGWEFEIPRYQATMDLGPALLARYRDERPFSASTDESSWQYGKHHIAAGEIVETTAWPHRSFIALNHSAKVILQEFMLGMKSRMPVSPWRDGRVCLDNGLNHDNPPAVNRDAAFSAVPPVGRGITRGTRPRVA